MISCKQNNCLLHQLIQKIDSYQNFIVQSDFLAEDSCFNDKSSILDRKPSITYSLDANNCHKILLGISNYSFSNIQSSLIIFYAVNFSEIWYFIGIIIHIFKDISFVGKRPKLLVVLSKSFESYDEIAMILKINWEYKFLDFSIITMNSAVIDVNSVFMIHYFNPFNNVIYRKEIDDKNIEVFPDKLKNAYGYPLHFDEFNDTSTI